MGFHPICIAPVLGALLAPAVVEASEPEDVRDRVIRYNIPAQDLDDALRHFAQATGVALIFSQDLVRATSGNRLRGTYTPRQAIRILLRGTGLRGTINANGVLIISGASAGRDGGEAEMKMDRKAVYRAGTILGAAASAAGGQSASAQEREPVVVQTIVVSAEKRDQNVQDVAQSIAVVDGERIEQTSASSVLDVTKITPGIIYQDGNDQRISRFAIRGISTPATFTGNDPSAAIMLDGEVFARSTALHNDLADVERVEVLKGPQGTLFGKNVAAGALHIITKRPSLGGTEGYVRFDAAEDDEYRVTGAVNVAAGDNAALRVNAFYKNVGGWVENLQPGQDDGGQQESYGVRGQLLFEPSPDFSILLRGDYSEAEYGPGTRVYLTLDPTLPVHDIGQTPFGPENTQTRQFSDRDFGDLTNFGLSLEANAYLGDYTLTYAGYYRDYDLSSNENFGATLVNVTPIYFAGPTRNETHQHELRIASPAENRFNFVAGLFYANENTFRSELFTWCSAANDPATVIDPTTFAITSCAGNGQPTNVRTGIEATNVKKDNYAIFGQANFEISEGLVLIGGLRVLREEDYFDIAPIEGFRNYGFYSNTFEDTAVIGRVGFQAFPTPNTQLYATYSTGYKGPAFFNTPGFTDADAEQDTYPTEPENTSQIEAGIKTDLFDRRVRFNLAVYQLVNENFQERVRSAFSDAAFAGQNLFRVTNVPELTSRGVDFEIVAAVSDGLTLSASGAYTDAKVTDGGGFLFNGGCRPGTEDRCVDDNGTLRTPLDGSRAAMSPEWQFFVSGMYEFELGPDWEGSIRADFRYLDDQFAFIDNRPTENEPAYGVADLYLTLNPSDEWVQVNLYVKNVFDKQYYTFYRDNPFSVGDPTAVAANAPRDVSRYIGGSVKFSF